MSDTNNNISVQLIVKVYSVKSGEVSRLVDDVADLAERYGQRPGHVMLNFIDTPAEED